MRLPSIRSWFAPIVTSLNRYLNVFRALRGEGSTYRRARLKSVFSLAQSKEP